MEVLCVICAPPVRFLSQEVIVLISLRIQWTDVSSFSCRRLSPSNSLSTLSREDSYVLLRCYDDLSFPR
ncbi:unnamed protein product, partial [Nesidiocoris tenuis]